MTPASPFFSRVIVATLLIAAFAILAWADATAFMGVPPAWWLLPILVMFAVGGVDELARLFSTRDLLMPAWTLRCGVVATFLAVAVGNQAVAMKTAAADPVSPLGWALAAFSVAAGCLFVLEVIGYRPQGRSLERLAAGFFTLAYLGIPMAFMVGLRLVCVENVGPEQSGPGHRGIVPLVSMVAAVKAGDILAYVVGSLIGSTKMAPTLSPGKTWEGGIASLTGSVGASWLVLHGLGLGLSAGPWGGWLLYGLLVGGAAMLGDLAESLIKREAGAKDSGRSLGGLGGVLDLVDSLLFAAPVAWGLWVAG
ncbi:MAG: phosphatidate cytidylyltransferase [Planctomycetia bacterium]